MGQSYIARVSASLLTSVGLSELITFSEKEYEEKALHIVQNPEKLISLKSKLDSAKESSPLFNSELFRRDLATKYIELIKSHSF